MLARYKWFFFVLLVAVGAWLLIWLVADDAKKAIGEHPKSTRRGGWTSSERHGSSTSGAPNARTKRSQRMPRETPLEFPGKHQESEPIFTMATLPRDQSGVYLVRVDGEIVEVAVDVPNEAESPVGMENFGESE